MVTTQKSIRGSDDVEPFLEVARFHLSETKARILVIRLLKATGATRPVGRDWSDASYMLRTDKQERSLDFREMVEEARCTGGVSVIQGYLDARHALLGGTLARTIHKPARSEQGACERLCFGVSMA